MRGTDKSAYGARCVGFGKGPIVVDVVVRVSTLQVYCSKRRILQSVDCFELDAVVGRVVGGSVQVTFKHPRTRHSLEVVPFIF